MFSSNSSGPTPRRRLVSGGSSADDRSSRPQTLRATWHDYRQRGVYMLTICTEGCPLLGRLEANEAGVGIVRLTPLGTALERVQQGLRNEYKEVEVIRWVVMPDHLHVVVQVHQVMSRHPWPEQPLSNRQNKGRFELMNAMYRVLCGLLP